MDWEQYKERLRAELVNWFEQVTSIQQAEYSDEEVLFELNKNTLDAFSAMVDAYSSGFGFEKWIENEKIRQRQKSLQGKLGDLHELMVKALNPNIRKREAIEVNGYDRPLRIYDLYDELSDHKWIAEIKNKHNTTKGDDRKASFDKLNRGLELVDTDFKAYYVTILRKSHIKINEPFTPSDNTNGNNKNNSKIIHIDGESFYEKITGEKEGLSKAFDILNSLLKEHYKVNDCGTILNELKSFSFFNKKVNVNTASENGLTYLPGMGEKAAVNLIDFRAKNGAFEKLNELTKVDLIGQATLKKITPFIDL